MPEQDNAQTELPLAGHGEDWYVPQHIVERNQNAAVYPPPPFELRPKPMAWTIREQDWNV
jgi:hypothetical protein